MSAVLEKIDEPEHGSSSTTPLVLIHDGSGTIFHYYMLGPLNRTVYGVAYPYFDDQTMPPGDLHQLATEYAEAIRETIGKGSVIVGGWSFGGSISLEISRILEADASLNVTGLLMIDSYCPWSAETYQTTEPIKPSFRESTIQKTKDKVKQSYENARNMLLSWEKPPAFNVPRAVMIRASNATLETDSSNSSKLFQDTNDHLGWSEYRSISFLSTIDVPGNHFNMFDDSMLDNLTEKINVACIMLEEAIISHTI